MTDDLRKAIDTVKKRDVIGEKEIYIDRCDLDPRDIEILKHLFRKAHLQFSIRTDALQTPDNIVSAWEYHHFPLVLLWKHDINNILAYFLSSLTYTSFQKCMCLCNLSIYFSRYNLHFLLSHKRLLFTTMSRFSGVQ